MIKKQLKLSDFKSIKFDFPEKKEIFDNLIKIIQSDFNIIIGVSGGPDSMFVSVLLYIFFLENNFPIKNLNFVHCNHKIRKESEQEQKFIEKFFKGFNLDVFLRDSLVSATLRYASASEGSLRKRRYECFEKVVKKCQSQKKEFKSILVLGHNLTDRIETSFLNLCRGASLNGLISIKPYEFNIKSMDYGIFRPVLGLSKKYIENLCKKFDVPYAVDLSNFDSKTSKRNYLRNEILPLIYKMSNRQNDDTNTFIESMKNVYNYFDLESQSDPNLLVGGVLENIKLSKYWKVRWGYVWKINREKIQIKNLVEVMKYLKIYSDVGSKFLTEITQFLSTKNDGYKYFNGTYFFISHGKIYIINGPKLFWEKNINEEMKVKKLGKVQFGDFEIDIREKGQNGSIIRFGKQKDIYKGKNLNKYLLNKKIPIFWRNFVPVLVKNRQIIGLILK